MNDYRLNKRFTIILSIGLLFFGALGSAAKEWNPNLSDTSYQNPVIFADYSDPDVVPAADGSGYYMTASSFQCVPGLPVLFSPDLVNWEIVNYALEQVPPEDFYDALPRHGKGVWAPSIRYHNGEYYIYWGDPDFGIFMVKSDNPRGAWSKPFLVKGGKGMIDPMPFWDEDGKAYLVHAWAASRSHFNSVLSLWEMCPEGTELLGTPRIVFDGNDGTNHTCEGPKLFKRDGWYYILCPAGGVDQGWQLAMRSQDIFGPYEARTVLSQGSSDINGPHQGGLVETPEGESWFLHFQEFQPWGRIIHLNPVKWVDGWPEMGNNGEPVRRHAKPVKGSVAVQQTSDEFDNGIPGLQWQWHANYRPDFGMGVSSGAFRVYGWQSPEEYVNLWTVPNLLLQKFSSPEFTATAKLTVTARSEGQMSGLVVMGRDYGLLGVEKTADGFVVKQMECLEAESGAKETEICTVPLATGRSYTAGLIPNHEIDIWLRVNVDRKGICRFSFSTDGEHYTKLPTPFKAREGKWIGAKLGIFSLAGSGSDRNWVDVDYFHVD